MNKKIITFFILVIVILLGIYIGLGVFYRENPLQNIVDNKPEKVTGEITSFYVARPNLVVETTNLTAVTIYGTPADRNLEDVVLGSARAVEEFGNRKTWILEIPTPQLVRKIYAIGTDEHDQTTEREVFPIAGITEIYASLWTGTPAEKRTLHIGEKFIFGSTEFTFNKILEDSRCPSTVQCIQAGRLATEILVTDSTQVGQRFIVSSNDEELHIDNYFLSILSVEPVPQEDPLPDSAYTVTFSIIPEIK